MTDPNYWLAAWLVFMNVFIFYAMIGNGTNRNGVLFLMPFFIGNMIAISYCAGFVVVTP